MGLTALGGMLLFALVVYLTACDRRVSDCESIGVLARNGFARAADATPADSAREVCVWGYVDRGNLYGDPTARRLLGDWWSGPGPSANTWRFDLLGQPDDAPGQGVAVHVPNDSGRDALLRGFATDADAGRTTRVCARGQLVGTPAPTNLRTLTLLSLRTGSSGDIWLASGSGMAACGR
jgi:hypothetical protein